MSTKDVLDRHMAAFLAGDLDATLADYADDAVMMSARGVLRGLDEIRANFERIFTTAFVPGQYTFVLDVEHIDGEVAYVAWHSSSPNLNVPTGSDTFVIRDGKIVAQSVTLHVQPV